MVHQGGPDLELMSALAGVYDAAAPSLRVTAPHCSPDGDADGRGASKVEERPIRIGQEREGATTVPAPSYSAVHLRG